MRKQVEVLPGVYMISNKDVPVAPIEIKVEQENSTIIVDRMQEMNKKIKMLEYGNSSIKEEQSWELDDDLTQAIEQNCQIMEKVLKQMKDAANVLVQRRYTTVIKQELQLINLQIIQQKLVQNKKEYDSVIAMRSTANSIYV